MVHKFITETEWTIKRTDRFTSGGRQRLPDVEVVIKFCPFCATELPVGPCEGQA